MMEEIVNTKRSWFGWHKQHSPGNGSCGTSTPVLTSDLSLEEKVSKRLMVHLDGFFLILCEGFALFKTACTNPSSFLKGNKASMNLFKGNFLYPVDHLQL